LLSQLEAAVAYQLDTDRPEGAFERHPTHWPLVFPEVFEQGGFDAVIGNPPFLHGQKLTGALGTAYREYLVRQVAGNARGSADLVAYFLLVAHKLLNGTGQTGLIGTNTIAQGDTREVGLDQITSDGVTIRAAVKSAHWPTHTVSVDYAVLWSSRCATDPGVMSLLDGRPVPMITSSLDVAYSEAGKPFRLGNTLGRAFIGSYVLGMGFAMSPEAAQDLINRDPRNREVLFPYISGEDLNSRPDASAGRWVINFRDWPLERAGQYPECLDIVRRLVKPARDKLKGRNPTGNDRARNWWRYGRRADSLYKAIDGKKRVLAIVLHSATGTPVFVDSQQVFSHGIAVLAYEDYGHLALLTSGLHYWWAITWGSTLGAALRYTPTDVFETFSQPIITDRMQSAGEKLDAFRRRLMLDRQVGLTPLYTELHNQDYQDGGVIALRGIHVELDQAVMEAYGWDDVPLEHGFHETRQGVRFTISAPAREAILRRLLELNHRRHDEEVAARGGVLAL